MKRRAASRAGRALAFTAAGFALALAPSACIRENAFLEVDLELPRDSVAPPRFAVVGVQTEDVTFEETWETSDPLPAVELTTTKSSSLRFSVEGLPETEAKAIRIKVRFCGDPSCAGIGDDNAPEAWFEIERAFYLGKSTSVKLAVACIPGDADCDVAAKSASVIPKCKIQGCREGVTSSFCTGEVHFCEE